MATPEWPACSKPQADQKQSPLFSKIPGEVRNKIFKYALTSYEDQSRLYDEDAGYRRPGYLAPHKIDWALLQTCQNIYVETWDLPITTNTVTVYCADVNQAKPKNMPTGSEFRRCFDRLYIVHGELDLLHVRVYASTNFLCPCPQCFSHTPLCCVVNLEHFNPKVLTVAVRHMDWDGYSPWGSLRLGASWVKKICIPASVTSLRLELETVKRRYPELLDIVQQIRDSWQFRNTKGEIMTAREEDEKTFEWTESSLFNNGRAVEDEISPQRLQYVVKIVVFGVDKSKKKYVNSVAIAPRITAPAPNPRRELRYISNNELELANVPDGADADEAIKLVLAARQDPNHVDALLAMDLSKPDAWANARNKRGPG